jgi:dephospho-CoA kinase
VLRVGLTGGIASGKSHVLRALARSGLATLDLDRVTHDVTAPGGSAYDDVVSAFGPGVVAADGSLDRRALGAIVFGDASARARLDALVHPRVRAEEARRAAALEREGASVLVSDGALLVEAGAHLRFERLVVVHCEPEQQLARLVGRDGLPEAAARARIEAQMPAAEKRRFAHALVDSSGSPAETDEAADAVARTLRELAARPRARAAVDERGAAAALAAGDGAGPRGLSAGALLTRALDAGGLELAALAQELVPGPPSPRTPWYRLAREREGPPWPESLAVPLALWAAARGHDREWLAGAALSVCRLTHLEGEAIAGAVLAAFAAFAVARGEGPAALPERLPGWAPDAIRWGDALPARRVLAAIEAAARAPRAPAEARRQSLAAGGEPALAGSLVGLATGEAGGPLPPAIAVLAHRLSRPPAPAP